MRGGSGIHHVEALHGLWRLHLFIFTLAIYPMMLVIFMLVFLHTFPNCLYLIRKVV